MSALHAGRTVLVSGVGGAPGLDLARALQHRRVTVIAADADPLAAGLLLPGVNARTVPPATAPGFGDALLGLCADLRPDAFVPTVEAELEPAIAVADDLARLGVRTWLPALEAVRACTDKAAFAQVLACAGLPAPRTWLPSELDQVPDGTALVVKPRRGQGAKGVHFCATRDQAAVLCELVPDPVVQERLAGQEFTADCLVDHDGTASVVLRHRLLVRNGLAMVADTFHDDHVAAVVRETLAAVGITGLCCAQGFLTNNGPRITEVNARIAGAFTISHAAGADLVGQMLNGLFGEPIDHSRLTYRPGVRLTKCVDTLAITRTPVPMEASR